MALLGFVVPLVGTSSAPSASASRTRVWAKLFYRHKKLRESKKRFAGERGRPFWKRGPELLGRLRLRSSG